MGIFDVEGNIQTIDRHATISSTVMNAAVERKILCNTGKTQYVVGENNCSVFVDGDKVSVVSTEKSSLKPGFRTRITDEWEGIKYLDFYGRSLDVDDVTLDGNVNFPKHVQLICKFGSSLDDLNDYSNTIIGQPKNPGVKFCRKAVIKNINFKSEIPLNVVVPHEETRVEGCNFDNIHIVSAYVCQFNKCTFDTLNHHIEFRICARKDEALHLLDKYANQDTSIHLVNTSKTVFNVPLKKLVSSDDYRDKYVVLEYDGKGLIEELLHSTIKSDRLLARLRVDDKVNLEIHSNSIIIDKKHGNI